MLCAAAPRLPHARALSDAGALGGVMSAISGLNGVPSVADRTLLTGVLRGEPRDVADFLRHAKGLSKRRIGDYLGERGEFEVAVLGHYIALFDFGGMAFVEAVRAFLLDQDD